MDKSDKVREVELRRVGSPFFAKLPERFQWSFHNLVAHPLSEVLYQIGFESLGNRIHDWSIPYQVSVYI